MKLRKSKKRKYETDITIGDLIRIRHEDPCMVEISGDGSEWTTTTISTTHGAFYTIKFKAEYKKLEDYYKPINDR